MLMPETNYIFQTIYSFRVTIKKRRWFKKSYKVNIST